MPAAVVMMMKRRYEAGEKRACEGVDLAVFDVLDVQAFVDDGALLEEYLPGRNGGADIGHDDKKQVRCQSLWKGRIVEALEGFSPGRCAAGFHGPEGCGDVDEIESAEKKGDLLEGPIFAGYDDAEKDKRDDDESNKRRYANMVMAAIMPMYSVMRVSQLMIPRSTMENQPQKGPNPSKMGLGMTPLGHGAETHRHLLNVISHRDKDKKCPEEVETVLGARYGVCRYAPGVVVGYHGDDAGSQGWREKGTSAYEIVPDGVWIC